MKTYPNPKPLTRFGAAAAVALAALTFAAVPAAKAQTVLAGWDFDVLPGGSGNFGPSPFAPGTTAANLTAGGLTRGTGFTTTGTGASNGWGGTGLDGQTTAAGAINVNDFVTFTLTANPTYEMSLSSISAYNVRRSSTGPTSGLWQYQVGSGSFTDIGSTITWGSTTTGAGNAQSAIDLSAISALQGIAASTTVTFRLALWGASGSGGTWYLNDPPTASSDLDFIVNGTVAAAGGGGNFWVGNNTTLGGDGTWTQTGGTSWRTTDTGGTGVAFTPASVATFGGASPGVVTVSGTVAPLAGINFTTAGYSLTGGIVDLDGANPAANTITTASAVTTIGSTLDGSAGMTKAGAGTLVLSGANTISGGISLNAGGLSVSSAGNLGAAGNDVSFGGGTLVVTDSLTTGSGTDFTGFGTLDIAPSEILQVDGIFNMTATTLNNTGTLDLNGATRNVGALTFGAAATIDASGAISATSIDAAGLTSGTATINNAIIFSSGDKNLNVGTGGELVIDGDISGLTAFNRIVKLGEGTLVVNGGNTGGFRLGAAGTTNGGTLVVAAAAGIGENQFQFNYGTLEASSAMTITNDLSIGGREGTAAVVGGPEAIEFSGGVSWHAGSGVNHQVNVDNESTFSGVIASATTTDTKLVFGGAGKLTMSGASANTFTNGVVITDSLTVELAKTAGTDAISGGSVEVESGATLLISASNQVADGADVTLSGGTIKRASGVSESMGVLTLTSNSFLDFSGGTGATLEFSDLNYTPSASLVLNLANFTVGNTLVINGTSDWESLIGTAFTFSGAGGFGSSSFNSGVFTITAIPEPSTYVAAAGLLALMAWPVRRRLLRDAKSVLGLRAPMRDRLARKA